MKTILVIGEKYNDWTVLSYEGVDYKRRRRYFCRCKCGTEKSLVASSVFAGRTKMCIRCKATDLTGRHFFDWTVISRVGSTKQQKASWLCRCSCGREATVTSGNLVSGTSKRCFECGHNKSRWDEVIPTSWWLRQMDRAETRQIHWGVTEEEALAIFKRQNEKCALTGLEIGFLPMTASLDRIDSDGCYTSCNLQWVHKHLNLMKYRFAQDYFVKMCRLVAEKFCENG